MVDPTSIGVAGTVTVTSSLPAVADATTYTVYAVPVFLRYNGLEN